MSFRSRGGFTLIESAVQQVREAARKSQCQDHLHNIAIALMDYEVSFKRLPMAAIADYYRHRGSGGDTDGFYGNDEQKANWTWGALILPFIEQKPAYDRLQVGGLRAAQAIDNWSQTQQVFVPDADRLVPLPVGQRPGDQHGQQSRRRREQHDAASDDHLKLHGDQPRRTFAGSRSDEHI
jgi:hypothetical protein